MRYDILFKGSDINFSYSLAGRLPAYKAQQQDSHESDTILQGVLFFLKNLILYSDRQATIKIQ